MLLDCKDRILILDGAMGTELQRRIPGVSNFDALNLEHPDEVEAVHRAYIEAGADIIETNTFSANRISQAEYGLSEDARSMALEGARIARRAADASGREVLVAGSVGPTGKSLSLASDLSDPAFRKYSFDDMREAYAEQISALQEGGVDLILLETCFDALNVKAAICAMSQIGCGLPVMVSVSVGDRSGRTLTGQTLEAFYRSVEHANLWAFGLNCSLGAEELRPLVEEVASFARCRVSCYPNAGLPNEMGEYDQTPSQMASEVLKMSGLLNIAGGCCGTTPGHIAQIASALRDHSARPLPSGEDGILVVSGLEPVEMDAARSNFINIGERTNVAGSAKFKRLIASGAYEEALQVAAGQIEGGASVIDVNMDDAMLDSTACMGTFLRHVSNDPAVAKAAVMIDSSHWETVVEGLKNTQGKCIVNSISLKEGEEVFLAHAREISLYGAAMVVMAFDENGQATTYERKIEICERAYHLLVDKAGVRPQDIIFDVNVLSVGTGIPEHARYALDFIEAVRWIKANLPGALTSGGISNVSFAFRGNNPVREAMHSAFLYHATKAGLDMGIVNPGMLQIYDEIDPELLAAVEDVLLDRGDDPVKKLTDIASRTIGNDSVETPSTAIETRTPQQRLTAAVLKGASSTLQEDVLECLHLLGKPVEVIEGPLMEGMQKVGENFGAGKMFLPQVVKSAKVMRDAVAVLSPYMESSSDTSSDKPKVVIATVKGDVHDIGKNITAIVFACNGFDVTDLGVMVPKETILDEAQRIGADIIAVSGLITPSLFQMEEICREMSARGMTTPLFIGGATTSALHTAVKLAPLYPHVFHGPDASASAVMAKKCLIDRDAFETEQHASQQTLRELNLKGHETAASKPAEAFSEESYLAGKVFSDIPYLEIPLDELMEFFDWRMFFATWGVREDASLRKEAQTVISHMRLEKSVSVRVAMRFLDCVSKGDDIVFEGGCFPMMRQNAGDKRSLADFVVPEGSGRTTPVGVFSASVVQEDHPAGCTCEQCSSQYDSMLLRSVRVTLAEAASSWIDARLAAELGSSDIRIVKPAAGYSSCPDHTLKLDISHLLPQWDRLGITFTQSFAMIPDASICGFIFAHPRASYPEIRRLDKTEIEGYARRRGMSEVESAMFLGHLVG